MLNAMSHQRKGDRNEQIYYKRIDTEGQPYSRLIHLTMCRI